MLKYRRTPTLWSLPVILFLFCWSGNGVIWAQANRFQPARQIGEISVPADLTRIPLAEDSFGAWLRQLPLKPPTEPIRLYNGSRKDFQGGLYRVVDLPIGNKDLQQCADVVIRLRSDYLLSEGRIDEIAFDFSSGDRARYSDWIEGLRPAVEGNDVGWQSTGLLDSSSAAYQDYLNTVFMYAGSYSLAREMKRVSDVNDLEAGDCFVQGGFPGHVIIAVDVAVDTVSGEKYAVFAQGYTPAQDIHVLKNLSDSSLSPWYRIGAEEKLVTPEWTFEWSDHYRFAKRD